MMVDREKRSFYRMMLDAQAEIKLQRDGQQIETTGTCKDLSATGMALEMDNAVEVGEQFDVKLDGGSGPALRASVRTLRCERDEQGHYVVGTEVIEMV